MQLLNSTLVHDGNPRFLRSKVNQDIFGHGQSI